MDTAQEKSGRGTVAMGAEVLRRINAGEGQRAAFGHEKLRTRDVIENTMAVVEFLAVMAGNLHNGSFSAELTPNGAMGFSLILEEVNRNLDLAWRELVEGNREK